MQLTLEQVMHVNRMCYDVIDECTQNIEDNIAEAKTVEPQHSQQLHELNVEIAEFMEQTKRLQRSIHTWLAERE